jgi:hypothetical protein
MKNDGDKPLGDNDFDISDGHLRAITVPASLNWYTLGKVTTPYS